MDDRPPPATLRTDRGSPPSGARRRSVRRPLLIALALAAVVPCARAGAQDRPALSLDLTLGPSAGAGGGPFRDRSGVAVDAIVAGRVGRRGAEWLLAGGAVGIQGPVSLLGSDGCDDYLPLEPPPCPPKFPAFYVTAALAGLEAGGGPGWAARALAGPALFVQPDSGRALGVQGRADLATPSFLRLALVVSGRAAVLPRYRGSALYLAAAGVGVRIQ